MKKIYFPILFLSFIYSCTSVIDINTSNIDNKITLNCILIADSTIKVKLNESAPINKISTNYGVSEDLFPPIENAEVQIFENDTFLSELTYTQNGFYIDSLHHIKAGKFYRIKVNASGYDPVDACDTIPRDLKIVEKEFSPDKYDPNYNGLYNYKYTVLNNNLQRRYYTSYLKVEYFRRIYNADSIDYYIYDDIYGYPVEFENMVAESVSLGINIFVFSNKGFEKDKETFSVPFSIFKEWLYNQNTEKYFNIYIFGQCSPAFFRFAQSLAENTGDDNYFTEKSQVYSNVNGGLGILMSQNLTRDTLFFYQR